MSETDFTDEEKVNILYALAQANCYDLMSNDWYEGNAEEAESAYRGCESEILGYMKRIREINTDFKEPVSYLTVALMDGYSDIAKWCIGRVIDAEMLKRFRAAHDWIPEDKRDSIAEEPLYYEARHFSETSSDDFEIGLFSEALAVTLLRASEVPFATSWMNRNIRREMWLNVYNECESRARELVELHRRLSNDRCPTIIGCDFLFKQSGIDTNKYDEVGGLLFMELRSRFDRWLENEKCTQSKN